MNYSFFLFTSLFIYNSIDNDDKYLDIPFDELYPIVVELYNKFLDSEYNVPSRGEYDCMVDFLNRIE